MESMIKKMSVLDKIGKECFCELYLPPIDNRNNPFFVLDATNTAKGSKLAMALFTNNFTFKIHSKNEKKMKIFEIML